MGNTQENSSVLLIQSRGLQNHRKEMYPAGGKAKKGSYEVLGMKARPFVKIAEEKSVVHQRDPKKGPPR